jgi:hypothetical protein
MKKVIKLNESDLINLIQRVIKESTIEEGIFGGISDIGQGLKGVWRGEGYDYFKYINTLKRITQDLKKLDAPNHKIMIKLTELKNKIGSSKMNQQKKDNLTNAIDQSIRHFTAYAGLIDQIEQKANQKLN